mmetsp:Transcript_13244/g.30927  ORF Transcript_13244/g.30927 Transcript_13244/m.30927 type:complete len:691 (-) Transcript_13244:236-2308(-)
MSVNEDSPSAMRRKALKEADSAHQIRILESCQLSKYVDIADRLLERFQDAVDGRRLDEAYVFGLRFANLCLSGLPQHPEWTRDATSKGRKRLTSQVGDVLCMMDVIKQRMDAEELMKIKAEMIAEEEEERQKKEEEDRRQHGLDEARRREQEKRDALEKERIKFLAEQRSQEKIHKEKKQTADKKKDKEKKKKEIEQSAMAKLMALQAQTPSAVKNATPIEKKEGMSVASSKGSAKIFTNAKATQQKKKIRFLGGKPKSTKTKKEENTSSSLPSRTDDNAKKTALTAAVVDINLVTSADATETTKETYSWPQDIQQQQPQGKKTLRKLNENKKIESSSDANKKIESSSDANKKIESSSDTILENNTVASEKRSVSESSTRMKKSTPPGSSVKPKILASISGVKPKKKPDSANTTQKKVNKKEQLVVESTQQSCEQSTQNSSSSRSTVTSSSGRSLTSSHGAKPLKVDVHSTAHDIIEAQLSPTRMNRKGRQLTPMSRKEKATIDNLQRAISVQEDRLKEIETKQIPYLLQTAKKFLKDNKRQEALKCLAHKKRLERQSDAIKAGIFNMETQMFMLESAFEDRHVMKALEEAASAIAGYQQIIGDPKAVMVDLTNMHSSLPDIQVEDATDEELMEELTQWLSPEEKKRAAANKNAYADDADISFLTVPSFLPVPTLASIPDDRVLVADPGT